MIANPQWPATRRAQKSAEIRQTRPWEKTKGPVSPEGMAIVSLNAAKHYLRSRQMEAVRVAVAALIAAEGSSEAKK